MSDTFTGADIEAAASASTTSAEPSTSAPETTAAVSTPDTTTSASASAPTTVAPAVVDDPDSPDSVLTGPIPPERVKRILENTRKKEAEKVQKAFEEKYGFTQTTDPQELQAALDWTRRANADPVGFVTNLWEQVQSNPQLGPQLRSQAARILGQRQAQPAADERPQPDVPTIDDQGRQGRMVYSAEQLDKLLEWNQRKAKQDLLQEFAPLREEHARTQQEREWHAVTTQADQFAATTMDAVSKLPGFSDHAKTIMERYAALPTVRDPQTGWMVPDPKDPRTEDRKLLDIYHEVVLPTFQQTATRTAVHDLQQKARATTLNPAGGGTAEPFDHRKASWAESIAYEAKKRGWVP